MPWKGTGRRRRPDTGRSTCSPVDNGPPRAHNTAALPPLHWWRSSSRSSRAQALPPTPRMRSLLQNHQRNASMPHNDACGTTASDLPTRAHPPGLPPRASRAMGLHPAKRRLGRHASKAACRHTPCRAGEGAGRRGGSPGALQMPPEAPPTPLLRALLLPHTARVQAGPCGNAGGAGAHQWKRAPTRSALRPFRTSHTSTPPAPARHHHRPPSSPRRAHSPRPDRHHATITCHVVAARRGSQFPYGSESSAALNE